RVPRYRTRDTGTRNGCWQQPRWSVNESLNSQRPSPLSAASCTLDPVETVPYRRCDDQEDEHLGEIRNGRLSFCTPGPAGTGGVKRIPSAASETVTTAAIQYAAALTTARGIVHVRRIHTAELQTVPTVTGTTIADFQISSRFGLST